MENIQAVFSQSSSVDRSEDEPSACMWHSPLHIGHTEYECSASTAQQQFGFPATPRTETFQKPDWTQSRAGATELTLVRPQPR